MRSVGFLVVAVLTAVLVAYPATASPPSVVATVNGGGTAIMDPASFAQGTTAFEIHATLYKGDTPGGGPAKGHIMCVDQQGSSTIPGNVFGEVTSWEETDGEVILRVTGKFVSMPGGHPQEQSFTVRIQKFGGAGVGHWTLSVPDGAGGEFTFCVETVSSGQIVMRRRT